MKKTLFVALLFAMCGAGSFAQPTVVKRMGVNPEALRIGSSALQMQTTPLIQRPEIPADAAQHPTASMPEKMSLQSSLPDQTPTLDELREKMELHQATYHPLPMVPMSAPTTDDDYSPALTYLDVLWGGEYIYQNGATTHTSCSAMGNVGGCCYGNGYYSIGENVSYNFPELTFFCHLFDIAQDAIVATNSFEESDQTNRAYAMDYDPTTGKYYGCFPDEVKGMLSKDIKYYLGTRNIWTGVATHDLLLEERLQAMAINPQGEIYAFTQSGALVKVDKTTGTFYVIGETGLTIPTAYSDATIDPWTGNLYLTFWDIDTYMGNFYQVDLLTAQSTLFYSGLYVYPAALHIDIPEDKADRPAHPTLISSQISADQSAQELLIATPSATLAGTAVDGLLTIHLVVDGTEVATAQANAGQQVTLSATATTAWHNVTLYATQDDLQGATLQTILYFGADTPNAVKDITLTNQDNTSLLISWTAPSASEHNGWFDPASVTYKVVRDNDGFVLANGISETSVTDPYQTDEIECLSYTVIPCINGIEGPARQSSVIAYGEAFNVPVSFDMEDSDRFYALFETQDRDDDGLKWYWHRQGYALFNWIEKNYGLSDDDYLLLPAIRMQAGRNYHLTMRINGIGSYNVLVGKERQYSSMQPLHAEPVLLEGSYSFSWYFQTVNFTPSEDGIYYFAVEAVQDTYEYYLSIDEIFVDGGAEPEAPSVATFQVSAGEEGALFADITGTAPTQLLNGADLTALTAIEILRNGHLIATLTDVQPGAEFSYTDHVSARGITGYQMVAVNADRRGECSDVVSTFIGNDYPALPKEHKIKEFQGAQPLITWKSGSLFGGYIGPMTCRLYNALWKMDRTSNIDTQWYDYDYKADSLLDDEISYPSEPMVIQYYLTGIQNEEVYSTTISQTGGNPYGPGCKLPYQNGCTRNDLVYWAYNEYDANGGGLSPTQYADGDGYSFVFNTNRYNNIALVNLPKVSLADSKHPELTFSLLSQNGTEDYVDIEITTDTVMSSAKFTLLKRFCFTEATELDWTRLSVSLEDYVGQDISVRFVAHSVTRQYYIFLDWITIHDTYEQDVRLMSMSTSANSLRTGDTVECQVAFDNYGRLPVQNFQVELYANQQLVDSASISSLAQFQSQTVALHYTPAISDADTVQLQAKVNYLLDEDPSNNQSEPVTLVIKKPLLPAATDLKADFEGDQLQFSWIAPDLEQKVTTVTDDFESYQSFIISDIGDWTLYDIDPSEGTYTWDLVEYPHQCEPMAYQVFDLVSTSYSLYGILSPHSGNQVLWAISDADKIDDNWLITPELSGNEQTITFYTNSAMQGYDYFEVYYSTSGKAISDFIQIGDELESEEGEWVERSFTVPAGTKYFAVRETSFCSRGFGIDDFTYEALVSPTWAQLQGYNLYCNGVKINDALITETSTLVVTPLNGSYYVTAVYDLGESETSNAVDVDLTGITDLTGDTPAVNVYDLNGRRIVEIPSQGLYIYNGKSILLR